jgi:hypothetical protein
VDVTAPEMISDVFLEGQGFRRGQVVQVAAFKLGVGFKIDGVVPRLVLGEPLGSAFAKDSIVFAEFSWDVLQEGGLGRVRGKVHGVRRFSTYLRSWQVLRELMQKVKVRSSEGSVRREFRGGGAGFQRTDIHCRFEGSCSGQHYGWQS